MMDNAFDYIINNQKGGIDQCTNQILRRVVAITHDLHAIDAALAQRRDGAVLWSNTRLTG